MNPNPFDFGYVFSTPDDVWGPYSTAFFIVFTLGTIVSNLVFFWLKYRFRNNLLTYTLVNRASRNASIAFSLGFFFFLCRIAKLQPFNARLFLDVALLLVVFFIIRGIIYMFRTYPKARTEWQARQARETRKNEPRATAAAPIRPATPAKVGATATAAPAKVATTAASVSSNGSSDGAAAPVIAPATEIRGLSERGQKRRERKRNKR